MALFCCRASSSGVTLLSLLSPPQALLLLLPRLTDLSPATAGLNPGDGCLAPGPNAAFMSSANGFSGPTLSGVGTSERLVTLFCLLCAVLLLLPTRFSGCAHMRKYGLHLASASRLQTRAAQDSKQVGEGASTGRQVSKQAGRQHTANTGDAHPCCSP